MIFSMRRKVIILISVAGARRLYSCSVGFELKHELAS